MLRSTCCILEIWGSLGKHVPVELHTLKTLKQTTSLKCNDSIGVWGCPQLSWLSSHCLLVRLHFQGVLFVGEELLPLLSTVQCGSLFVWTFDVCFLVLYTVLSPPPPKWISLCSAWICECLLPIQNLTFFSVSASDPKHLHSWSNPPDSVVPLNSLFAAAVVLGTWPQENWTGVQLWACKHHPWGEHWTAHVFQWATQILTGPALSPQDTHLPWWSQASFLDCGHCPIPAFSLQLNGLSLFSLEH